MGKVFFYMTVSVDGFVAGPADEVDRLFRWYFSGDTEIPIPGSPTLRVSKESAEILLDPSRTGGAMVTGRRNFDIAQAWGGNPPTSPCFVLTHSVPDDWAHEGSPFVFVTDGIESAIGQAKQAAGEKDVEIGTPTVLQQALNAGLVDEIHIDLVPAAPRSGRPPLRSPHDRAHRSRDHPHRAGAWRHAPSLSSRTIATARGRY